MTDRGIREGVRRLFRFPSRRRERIDDESDEELRSVLESRIEHLVARGLSHADARAEALRRLGGTLIDARRALHHSGREREARMQLTERIDDILGDVKYAARGLVREPLFTAFVVATLALGIGANAALFGIADRLLIRGPAHVRDASRIMRLYATERTRAGNDATDSRFGYVTYSIMSQNTRSFAGVAAYRVNDATMGRGIESRKVSAGIATSTFFPLLGVHPALGRFFTAEEDAPSGAQRVAVIGYQLWQRMFGGTNDVLGARLLLGDESYVVIGVAPRGFTGADLSTVDIWTPLSLLGSQMGRGWASSWSWTSIRVIVRLKPGVTRRQASDDATTAYRNAYAGGEKATAATAAARLTLDPLSFNDERKEPAELSISRWLVAVALIVLLIACANIINLLLARASRRRREIAVRLALGAGRGRLVRLLFAEGMLLAVVGGAAGLSVAYGFGAFVRRVLLVNVEWTTSPVDARVLLASLGVAIGAGILVGLLPGLQASRPNLTASLRLGARAGFDSRSRLRVGLTLAQAALSVVLLVGAGLFLRSVRNVYALDLGIEADRALAVMLNFPRTSSDTSKAQADQWQARRTAFYARSLERVRQLPGVEHASLSIGVPFRNYYGVVLYIPGRDSLPAWKGGSPRIQAVGSDYFATVGTRILRGRPFAPADGAGAERVLIVSDLMARTLWPNEDAIGRCIIIYRRNAPCARIIGIAANAYTRDIGEEPGLQYYVPFEHAPFQGMASLVVRPRGDPGAMTGTLRRALLDVDSTLTYLNIVTLRQSMDPQIRPWRLGATVFGLMGVLAIVVAAVGLYSVVSYLVTQRTHELGVRMALGARGADVVGLIVRHAVVTAAFGVSLGIALVLLGGRFIEPLLFRTSARDPIVLAGVAATIMVVAVLAGLLPALRARRVGAMEAIRSE